MSRLNQAIKWAERHPGFGSAIAAPIVFLLFVGPLVLFDTAGLIWVQGFRTAWALNGHDWINAVARTFAALAVGGLMLGGIVRASLTVAAFARRHPALPWRKLNKGGQVLVWVGGGVLMAWGIFAAGAHDGTDQLRRSSGVNASQTLQDQKKTITDASANAQSLIGALDRTEAEIRAAKTRVTETLDTLQQEQKTIGQYGATLEQTSQRQAVLDLQLAQLQKALGGREPITRSDLDRAQMTGWIQGVVTGLPTSLLASYIWQRASRRRRPDPGDDRRPSVSS